MTDAAPEPVQRHPWMPGPPVKAWRIRILGDDLWPKDHDYVLSQAQCDALEAEMLHRGRRMSHREAIAFLLALKDPAHV